MSQPSHPNRGSGLFYFGTDVEVRLGDRILWKRLLRRSVQATVVYIPGLCPRHPDLEYEDIAQWAFELEDGSIAQMGYCPERSQPKRNLQFIERGTPKPLSPADRLH